MATLCGLIALVAIAGPVFVLMMAGTEERITRARRRP
jgi:hypothetical protein